MSACKTCHLEMLLAPGCSSREVRIHRRVYPRVPFGEESVLASAARGRKRQTSGQHFIESMLAGVAAAEASSICNDCGARRGNFHHPPCDREECPRCHGQFLLCQGDRSHGGISFLRPRDFGQTFTHA